MSENKRNNQSDSLWGSQFTRTASIILLGAILLMAGRYVYLKVTNQYSATYEQQDIIQHPHLDELRKNQKRSLDTNGRDTIQ
jgi:hypothetical protein